MLGNILAVHDITSDPLRTLGIYSYLETLNDSSTTHLEIGKPTPNIMTILQNRKNTSHGMKSRYVQCRGCECTRVHETISRDSLSLACFPSLGEESNLVVEMKLCDFPNWKKEEGKPILQGKRTITGEVNHSFRSVRPILRH